MSLANKLTNERRNRLAAERLLELKQAELFAANQKLGEHAQQLTEQIVETRAEVEVIRDENQRVKSDLTAANQRIALTERRLWQSIQSVKDGFALFNGDNKLIMANRAYLAIFDGVEDIRPGVDYVTILQVLTDEGIVNTGDLSPSAWRQEMIERIQRDHPEPMLLELWNETHVRVIDQRSSDGDMVSIGIDITATVAYERQLKEARAVAESANRAKSAFLANMSHEIRTPMNGVVGMADILSDTELSEDQRLYVETIRNSGEALLVIINDVLDYSKIEAERLSLQPEKFDLERAIQEVLMLLHPAARTKDLTLLLDYDIFLPTLLIGDQGRIRQVLTNLLGNAVKFTNEGHVLIRVTGVPDRKARRVRLHIAIEDTGIGIPPDKIDEIFGEFNQVQNERNRQFDGTGLGLSISQKLVALMGGEISVTSTEGSGSCFSFQADLGLPGESEGDALPPIGSLGQIVLVSEREITRSLLSGQLGRLGAEVRVCDSAEAALAQIGAPCSLVLAEHQKTGLDGVALARALRAQGSGLPVLLLCENPADAEGHPDRAAVQGILKMPPSRGEMIDQIIKLCGGQAVPEGAPDQAPRVMRILAAEDNKTNQLVFRKMIKHLDVDLTFANDGEEAVERFRQTAPDLVFMDISMPKLDGKKATQAIRALEEGKGTRVPIVALTAHAMIGDDKGILKAGLDHYLTKPLRKPEIIAQIEAAHDSRMRPLLPDPG